MNKFFDNFYNILIKSVDVIFFAIVTVLLLQSGFSTAYIVYAEHTLYLADSIFLNLAFSVSFLILGLFVWKKSKQLQGKFNYDKIIIIIYFIILAIGCILVLSSQQFPISDQRDVMRAADNLRSGDVSKFLKGKYISNCQNQIGFLLFHYFAGNIFGTNNFVAIQLINAVALVIMYKCFIDVCKLQNMKHSNILLLLLAGFLPLTAYVTFVYGNILGLLFSIIAFKYYLRFSNDAKKRYLLIMSISIGLAVVFKQNYLVFGLGLISFIAVEFFKKRNKKDIVAIACIAVSIILFTILPKMFIEHKLNIKFEPGISSFSYIAMGLQENNDLANGWYNGYNRNTYVNDSNCDASIHKQISIENIKSSVSRFKTDPDYAVKFFAKKNISQWLNPSFQGLWLFDYKESSIKYPDWFLTVKSAIFEKNFNIIYNYIQFLTLLLVIIGVLLTDHKDYGKDFFYKSTFIGGFIFHFIWEAKCQYTISYYVLLLPIAAYGLTQLYSKADKYNFNDFNIHNFAKNNFKRLSVCLFIVALATISCFNNKLHTAFHVNGDEEIYSAWMYENTNDYKPKSSYQLLTISPYFDTNKYLTEADNNTCLGAEACPIRIYRNSLYSNIIFSNDMLYMYLCDNNQDEYTNIGAAKDTVSDAQNWRIKKENNYVYILTGEANNTNAVTYSAETGEVFITRFNKDDTQKWIISK